MDFTGGDLLSAGLGAANTIYNMYTNKRDFDYQKALQQQIFEREDTAVQRRMNDLKAAGINPNLAAGSPASAGAVVGRSSTNDVNMGSTLDMIQAANSIRQQKQAVKNAQTEGEILDGQKKIQDMNKIANEMQLFHTLGFKIQPFIDPNTNKPGYYYYGTPSGNVRIPDLEDKFFNTIDYNYQNQKNSADLLQKDVDWYTADKISGMALGALGLGNSFKSWKSLFSK